MIDPLYISPSGILSVSDQYDASSVEASLRKVLKTLATSQGAGLLALATVKSKSPLSPSLAFWQDFARQYLTALCQTPESTNKQIEPIEPPSEEELAHRLRSVPPMRGAEYLNVEALQQSWQQLDDHVRKQVRKSKGGLAEFLLEHAPQWHRVGRVCFHLAENKRDPLYPFAFLATYIPGLSKQDRARYQPLGKALQQYAGANNKEALLRLLSPVHRASQQSEFVKELVDSGDIFHPLAWSPGEAHRFLKEVPLYEESGVVVQLPNWWQKRSRPQVGVTIGEKRQSSLATETLLDFRVGLALGDDELSRAEWEELLSGDEGLVLFKGKWVEVDREKLTQALHHWEQVEQAARDGALSFNEGMRLLAGAPADLTTADDSDQQESQWSFVKAGSWLDDTLAQLRNPQANSSDTSVEGLQATLRHYQQAGLEWLWLMTRLGLGACLADDMGLGKTIQVLALLLKQKQEAKPTKPSLLVLPASLLSNWKAELARFTPSLSPLLLHASETDRQQMANMAADPENALVGTDLVLTTYATLLRQTWLSEIEWNLIVLDEAQAIKNPASRQTKLVKKLKAHSRIALTGTPVENRLADLWSLFDFICPGLLGSAARFKKFVKQLEARDHDRYAPMRNLVQPYILRRLKTDKSIISDLPDKTEVKAYCCLTKRQAALYEKSVKEVADSMKHLEGIKRRGMVLAFLMRFKQICNHPSQHLGDGQYTATDSGKFIRLREICEEIASRQEKVLVFTQFREMTDPLHDLLAEVFERPGLVLHGGTAVGKRRKLVESFQREDGPPFFVLSIKAGGTGLNLTAASQVIHFDRWWNPAVENQATDRAFRIGQNRNVLVHKFVSQGTVEERIDELIDEKQSISDDLLQSGAEQLLTEMSNEQLIGMVSLDIDKATL